MTSWWAFAIYIVVLTGTCWVWYRVGYSKGYSEGLNDGASLGRIKYRGVMTIDDIKGDGDSNG